MNVARIYERFENFAHDTFRKKFSKDYSARQRSDARCVNPNWKTLSKAQKKEIAAYWGIKHAVKSDFYTHEIMLNVKGTFDVRYCPEKIFRLYLDPAMGNRKLLWAWDDKNYFERHQPTLPFPHTYVRNANGYFLDSDYRHIDVQEAKRIVAEHLPVIVKPSLISGEGRNIRLISNEAEAEDIFTRYGKDYVVQELIYQCEELKKTNPCCVNTLRLVTVIVDGKPKLVSSMLLCNTTDSIACNKNTAPGVGVVVIGIDEEGCLADTGYYENTKSIQTLPNGFTFGGTKIPSYREAVNLALNAHESMPMLGIIGWDVAIDKNNAPVFIEWNLRGIGMYHSQLTTGPIFGEYSDYFAEMAKKIISRGK